VPRRSHIDDEVLSDKTFCRKEDLHSQAYDHFMRPFNQSSCLSLILSPQLEIEQTWKTLVETESTYKAPGLASEGAYREKLAQLESDYQSAVHYIMLEGLRKC
jgi:hypothetical protein